MGWSLGQGMPMGTPFENHCSKSKATCFLLHFFFSWAQTLITTSSFHSNLDTWLKKTTTCCTSVPVKLNIHQCYPLTKIVFPHSLTSNSKVLTKESCFGLKSPIGPRLKIWDNSETADPKRLGEKWRLESLRKQSPPLIIKHSLHLSIKTAD